MLEIFKALADENRLRILNLLMNHSLCVCELETVLEMTQSNVSRHLAKLRSVGLISSSKDAQWIHYQYDPGFKGKQLIDFLKGNFEETKPYQKDLCRCRIYQESGYDCQTIRSDKDLVLSYIKSKM